MEASRECLYVLDRQYTQSGLKLASLQGEEYFRVQTLQYLSYPYRISPTETLGGAFGVLLATIEQEGSTLRLKQVVNLNGNQVPSDVKIDKGI